MKTGTMLDIQKCTSVKFRNIQHPETRISPRRRLYPPACMPCGLEAEPEAGIKQDCQWFSSQRPKSNTTFYAAHLNK
jgi:hypothetical protein